MSLRHQRPGLTTRTETTKRQVANGSDGCKSLVRTENIPKEDAYSILISEKKILPAAVLLVSAMYAIVAAIFYFE